MKWQLRTAALVAIAQLASQVKGAKQETCHTQYASTSITNVPSHTETTTVTVTSTSQVVVVSYTQTEDPYTYIVVSGKKTTTVPTVPHFTPIISAPSGRDPWAGKRAVERRVPKKVAAAASSSTNIRSSTQPTPSPTRFPTSVDCTTTVQKTRTVTTTSTEIITNVDYPTYTSTSYVATSTAYAACQSDNLVSEFEGHLPSAFSGDGVEQVCDPEYGTLGEVACVNAVTCCEAAQRSGYQGWNYYNGSYVECYFMNSWYFFTNPDYGVPNTYFGNGASGTGVHATN